MNAYDPMTAPDPHAWLELSEQDRIDMAVEAHAEVAKRLPNPQMHAAMHVVVETQAAMGAELEVARTLERLIGEGLDRHDAIHAIASVCLEDIFAILKDKKKFSLEEYTGRLRKLSAQSWRSQADEGD